MASYYWIATTTQSWQGNNWSYSDGGAPAGIGNYPKASGDIAIFTSTRSGQCYLSTNVIIAELDQSGGWTGILNLNNNYLTLSGDATIAGGEFWQYTGDLTVAGDLDFSGCPIWTSTTGVVYLTGEDKTLATNAYSTGATRGILTYDISGTYTTTSGDIEWRDKLIIRTAGSLTRGSGTINPTTIAGDPQLQIETGAFLDLNGGNFYWDTPSDTAGITVMAGSAQIFGGTLFIRGTNPTTGMGTWVWGTNGWNVNVRIISETTNGEFDIPNQECKFGGYLQFEVDNGVTGANLTVYPQGASTDVVIDEFLAIRLDTLNTGSVEIDNSGVSGNYWRIGTHYYDYNFSGVGGTATWTKNSEFIQFTGSANATVELEGFDVGTLQFFKTGTAVVTLGGSGNVTCDGFDFTGSGTTFNPNTSDVICLGHFEMGNGTLWTTGTGSKITLDGDPSDINIQTYPKVDAITLDRTGAATYRCVQIGPVNAISLTLTDGGWNCDTFDLTLDNHFSKGTDAVDLGTGDITVYSGINITGMDATDCRVVFAGTQSLTHSDNQNLNKLMVNDLITCTLAGTGVALQVVSEVDILLGGTLDADDNALWFLANCDVYIRLAAELNGSDAYSMYFFNTTSGHGLLLNEGSTNQYQIRWWNCAYGTRWAPGTHNTTGGIYIISNTTAFSAVKPDAGNFYLNGTGLFSLYHSGTGAIGLDMTNDPHFYIEGDCDYGGGISESQVNWAASDEILEFKGTLVQDYEWEHEVGNVTINKAAGTVANGHLDLTASAFLDCKDLTVLDGGLKTYNKAVRVNGDCVFGDGVNFVTIDSGTSDWEFYGSLDYYNLGYISGGFKGDLITTGTFTMHETGNLRGHYNNPTLYDFVVDAGKTVSVTPGSGSNAIRIANQATINGIVDIDTTSYFRVLDGADLTVSATGEMKGDRCIFDLNTGNHGLILIPGYKWNLDQAQFINPLSTSLIPAGTYGGGVSVSATRVGPTPVVWEPETGNYDIAGYLSIMATPDDAPFEINNRVNQPTFNIGGNLLIGLDATTSITVRNDHATLDIDWSIGGDIIPDQVSTFDWYKGTGSITLNGTGSQIFDFYDNEIEDVVINKPSGEASLTYHLKPDNFTLSSGDFDAGEWDVTTENVTISGTGTMTWGDGYPSIENTWYISGNEISHTHTGAHDTARSTIFEYSGVGKTLRLAINSYKNSVWIKSGASYTLTSSVLYAAINEGVNPPGTLTIDGILAGNSVSPVWVYYGDVHLNASGTFSAQYLVSYQTNSGYGIKTWDGDYDPIDGLLSLRNWSSGAVLTPGDYSAHDIEMRCLSKSGPCTVAFSSGTYTFYDWLMDTQATVNTLTIDTTSNPTINVKGSINMIELPGATVTYNRGSGSITCNDTGDVNVLTLNKPIDSFFVAKTGSVTLDSNFNPANFTVSSGDFSANGYDITTEDVTLSGAGTINFGVGSTWYISGNEDTVGLSGSYDGARSTSFEYTGVGKILDMAAVSFRGSSWIKTGASYDLRSNQYNPNINDGGVFRLDGTLTSSDNQLVYCRDGDVHLGATGVFEAYYLWLNSMNPGKGLQTWDGDYNPGSKVLIFNDCASGWVFVPGDYYPNDIDVIMASQFATTATYKFSVGTYNFYSWSVQAFYTSKTTLIDTTNDPTINIKGDIDFLSAPGILTYTKGSGTITCEDSGDARVDTDNKPIDNFVVAKNSSVTLDSDLNVASLTISSGDFDANDYNVTVTPGDTLWTTSGTVSMGSGTWTLSGDLDYSGYTGTLTAETSLVVMDGSTKTLAGTISAELYDLTISGVINVSPGDVSNVIAVKNDAVVSGALFMVGSSYVSIVDGGDMQVTSTGTVGGSRVQFWVDSGAHGLIRDGGSTWNTAWTQFLNPHPTSLIPVGTYDTLWIQNTQTDGSTATWEPETGTYDVSNRLRIGRSGSGNGHLTVDNTVNQPVFDVGGDLDFVVFATGDLTVYNNHATLDIDWNVAGNFTIRDFSTFSWVLGTGTVTCDGTGDVLVDTNNNLLEDFVVTKSSGVTLDSDLNITSLTISSGDFDANDYNVTVVNDTLWTTSGTISMGSGTWTLNGNFDYSGHSGPFDAEASLLVMNGAGKSLKHRASLGYLLNDVTINGATTTTASGYVTQRGTLIVNDTLTLTAGHWRMREDASAPWSGEVYVNTGGEITGVKTFYMERMTAAGGFQTLDGDLTMERLTILHPDGGTIPAYDYSPVDRLAFYGDGAFVWGSGSYTANEVIITNPGVADLTLDATTNAPSVTVNGNITFEATSTTDLYIDNSTQASTWVFLSDVIQNTPSTGEVIWTPGTGSITCSGTAAQNVDLGVNGEVAAFIVNKTAGTVTLTGNLPTAGLTISDGNVDANDFDIDVSGDTLWTTNDTITMGSGTWTLSGNFDYAAHSGGLLAETSLVLMDGVSKTIAGSNNGAKPLYNVTIDGTIATAGTPGEYVYQNGDLNINGTLDLDGQSWRMYEDGLLAWTGGVYVNIGGTLTGSRVLYVDRMSGGGGILNPAGTFSVGGLYVRYPTATGVLAPYDYSGISTVRVGYSSGEAGVLSWQTGAYTFNILDFYNNSATEIFTIDGRVNGPTTITVQGDTTLRVAGAADTTVYNNHATLDVDWNFLGDVSVTESSTGLFNWVQGSGELTCTGTGTQNIDLSVTGEVDSFVVDKTAGLVTLTSDLLAESFKGLDGTLDFNGRVIETTGDFIMNPVSTGFDIIADADAMDAVDITVGGDFYVTNVTFKATSAWYLDVTGSAIARIVNVQYSDARGGTTIDATFPGNVDSLDNFNWDFGGGSVAGRRIESLSLDCFAWSRMTTFSRRTNRRS